MAESKTKRRFVLCVKNNGYPASLEVRKVYEAFPDSVAEARNFIRVIDESGEDYLFPADFFVAIELPKAAVPTFAEAS